jgi:rare lipoprotein A
VDDRIIDVSYTAATKLGMATQGTALVEVVALDPPARDRTP